MLITRRTFLEAIAAAIPSVLAMTHASSGSAHTERAVADKREARTAPRSRQSARVVAIESSQATHWDFKTYPYVDAIDQRTVTQMLHEGIAHLTGQPDRTAAWKALFSTYRSGDIVAIKPNFNDLYDEFRGFVASPAVLNALLDGLVNVVGIPPDHIMVYDCTRIIPDAFRNRIQHPLRYTEPFGSSLPRKVRYKIAGNPLAKADTAYPIRMRSDVRDNEGRSVSCYLPRVITKADHIINVPILKCHQYVSHSGALKNHYGTVRFSDGHTGPEYLHPPVIHQAIVDINSHAQIRQKTRLVVCDGLFGRLQQHGGPPEPWRTADNRSPNKLLFSTDPVALDSISYDLIRRELDVRGEEILSHEFLHLAETANLGVHEHADQNGTYHRIEYISRTV